MNISLNIDEETRQAVVSMPRKMSASRLFRHWMKAVTYDDKKWSVYRKTDECKEVKEYIKPIADRLGA